MAAVALVFGVTPSAASPPAPVPCGGCYVPPLATSFQVDLNDSDTVDTTLDAAVFDLDWSTTSPATVAVLRSQGRKTYCYISVGSWENFRPDAASFPPEVLGRKYGGYPDERWLDVRRLDLLEPIMTARMMQCKNSGFDGVWFDNVDGFTMHPGFRITADEQLTYNATLANDAHSLGLSAAFNNDPRQTQEMVPYFDWVMYEVDRKDVGRCFYSRKPCAKLRGFRNAGKATFVLEYRENHVRKRKFCRTSRRRGFNGILKTYPLTNYRIPCAPPAS